MSDELRAASRTLRQYLMLFGPPGRDERTAIAALDRIDVALAHPEPSAELDVERLAEAMQNESHGASWRTRQGAIVKWEYLTEQQKALGLADAAAIADAYAALTSEASPE